MNNFVSIVIAILENAKILTSEEANKLVKELHGSTLPDNYESAVRFVKDLFNKHGIKDIESKLKTTTTGPIVVPTLNKVDTKPITPSVPIEPKTIDPTTSPKITSTKKVDTKIQLIYIKGIKVHEPQGPCIFYIKL